MVSAHAQNVVDKISVSGSGSQIGIDSYDTLETLGHSTVEAPTLEGARAMALFNAIAQASTFNDMHLGASAVDADEAKCMEEWNLEFTVYVEKTENGYEATAKCIGRRKMYTSMSLKGGR